MIRGITSGYRIEAITCHSLKINPRGCREPPRMVTVIHLNRSRTVLLEPSSEIVVTLTPKLQKSKFVGEKLILT